MSNPTDIFWSAFHDEFEKCAGLVGRVLSAPVGMPMLAGTTKGLGLASILGLGTLGIMASKDPQIEQAMTNAYQAQRSGGRMLMPGWSPGGQENQLRRLSRAQNKLRGLADHPVSGRDLSWPEGSQHGALRSSDAGGGGFRWPFGQ